MLEVKRSFKSLGDLLIEMLHAENIVARRYFYPGCHRMEPYRSFFPHASLLLPETERLARTIVVLPTGTAINEADASAICDTVRFITSNGKAVTAAMHTRAEGPSRSLTSKIHSNSKPASVFPQRVTAAGA